MTQLRDCIKCSDTVEPEPDGSCGQCGSIVDQELAWAFEEAEMEAVGEDNWRSRIVWDLAHGTGSYGS